MPKVTCIVMQRNEDLLVENWIKYYGYLFGYDRLIVLDNGSDNTTVIDTLRTYERAGVRVFWGTQSTHDFHEKGNIICRIIRELEDSGDDSDFYFPVDCDEFLTLYTENELICSRDAIHSYLESLLGVRASLRINSSLYNVPNHAGWFCPRLYDKGFVERNTILSLDHGFHYPKTVHSERTHITNFAYLHFHNKPLDLLRQNARTKLTGFVDPDDAEALARFSGAGIHLKRYFSMTPEDYAASYDGMLQLFIPAFIHLGMALGLKGSMLIPSDVVNVTKILISEDGSPESRSAPKFLSDVLFKKYIPLSTPDPLLAQLVRSKHTHV